MKRISLLLFIIFACSFGEKSYSDLNVKLLTIYIPTTNKIIPKDNWNLFIEALIQVESEGNPRAIGTKNDVGILQITAIYVKEANRIIGLNKYSMSCRNNPEKSLEMFEIIQEHYNPKKDINKAIKLHNPRASQSYKNKVIQKMNQLKILS